MSGPDEIPIPETRWVGRAVFAEVAETLGVRTDEIMAMRQVPEDDPELAPGGQAWVLYTIGTDDLETAVVHHALLYRDARGLMHKEADREVGLLREWWEQNIGPMPPEGEKE